MGREYDIAERMKAGSERPLVRIDGGHAYRVNTGKAAVLRINAAARDKKKDEFEMIDEVIRTALGQEALDYIAQQDMTMANIALIANVIMAAIADTSLEELEEAEKSQKKSR